MLGKLYSVIVFIILRGDTHNGGDITLKLQIDLNFDENTKLEGFIYIKYNIQNIYHNGFP